MHYNIYNSMWELVLEHLGPHECGWCHSRKPGFSIVAPLSGETRHKGFLSELTVGDTSAKLGSVEDCGLTNCTQLLAHTLATLRCILFLFAGSCVGLSPCSCCELKPMDGPPEEARSRALHSGPSGPFCTPAATSHTQHREQKTLRTTTNTFPAFQQHNLAGEKKISPPCI